ncbi:hypothetical protein JW960_20865 [candidate division KSB1 bacterium]|nr:hypothetical protein [candidate division KSB1 bacterium]
MTPEQKQTFTTAYERAVDQYIQSRYEKLKPFVKQQFGPRGALRLNSKALGLDLLKNPINVFWALPYTGLRLTGALCHKVGLKKINTAVRKLPTGFPTKVQHELDWLIYTELLELPCKQRKRESRTDALMETIICQPEVEQMFEKPLRAIRRKSKHPKFRAELEAALQEYGSSRIAVSDLAGSIIALSVGATVFHKMTPGSLATGTAIASTLAYHGAVSNFVLGSTLGSLYYSIFPVSVSTGLLVASIGSVMAALALITSFIGVVADPLQAALGIHQHRLRKLLDTIHAELLGIGVSKYELKDRYIARIFDFFDIINTAAMTAMRAR